MKRLGALSAAMIDSMIPLDGIATVSYPTCVREKISTPRRRASSLTEGYPGAGRSVL